MTHENAPPPPIPLNHHPTMKMKWLLATLLTLITTPLLAAELANSEEHAAVASIAGELFDTPPEWATHRGVEALIWSKPPLTIRITVDKAGNAVEYFSNGVPMTNARIAQLAALKSLKKVGFDHSGQWHFKEIPMEEFSGAGWEALTDSAVEEVRIGGSHIGQPTELALARMGSLRRLYLSHVVITAEGIAAISQHPGLETFIGGAQHNSIKGFSWYDALPQLAGIPNLTELEVNELFLTWDNSLAAIADNGKHLKRMVFGRGSVVFPEDVERLKAALPSVEVIVEPYDRALNANRNYAPRLKGLMTPEEFSRLEELAAAAPGQ